MGELKVYNLKNEAVGKEAVEDSFVKASYRPHLLHDYVVMQRRAMRQGTHSTKTRAEVSGSGKKPFRQKGTGNARQGTLIGPHQPGGGIAFGPKPRDYTTRLNKKAKAEALRLSISQKNYEGRLFIIDDFNISSGKTKDAAKALNNFKCRSAVIVGSLTPETKRSLRNLPKVKPLAPEGLNVYDVLRHQNLFITKAGLKALGERLKETA